MSVPALQIQGLSRQFGALKAVDNVRFDVAHGARHALIGPNGAGKSTLFALVAGTLRATSGRVLLAGDDVTDLPERTRVARGLVRTFQHSSLFLNITVLDNIVLAAQRRAGAAHQVWRLLTRHHELYARAHALLADVGLDGKHAALAGSLSHGERRQLEVAVALACEPSVLLLDEPAAGMSPAETAIFTELIRGLDPAVTVLLVEHDLDVVFGLADTVTVLHLGRLVLSGTPDEVRASEAVQAAYLGAVGTGELFPGEAP